MYAAEQDRLEHTRETRTLAEADRDIAEGEKRLAAQILLIEQLRASGQDTKLAEKLLETYRRP